MTLEKPESYQFDTIIKNYVGRISFSYSA